MMPFSKKSEKRRIGERDTCRDLSLRFLSLPPFQKNHPPSLTVSPFVQVALFSFSFSLSNAHLHLPIQKLPCLERRKYKFSLKTYLHSCEKECFILLKVASWSKSIIPLLLDLYAKCVYIPVASRQNWEGKEKRAADAEFHEFGSIQAPAFPFCISRAADFIYSDYYA